MLQMQKCHAQNLLLKMQRSLFQYIEVMLKMQNCLAQNGEVMLKMHKLYMHRM